MNVKEKLRRVFHPEETESTIESPLDSLDEFICYTEEIKRQQFNRLQAALKEYLFDTSSLNDLQKRIDQTVEYYMEVRNAAIIRAYELDHS